MSKKLEKLGRLAAKELTEERGVDLVFLVMEKDGEVLVCTEGTGDKKDIVRLLLGIKDGANSLVNDYDDIEQEERLDEIKEKLMKALRRKKLIKRDGKPSGELIVAMLENATVGKKKHKSVAELLNGLAGDVLTDDEVELLEDELSDAAENLCLDEEDED